MSASVQNHPLLKFVFWKLGVALLFGEVRAHACSPQTHLNHEIWGLSLSAPKRIMIYVFEDPLSVFFSLLQFLYIVDRFLVQKSLYKKLIVALNF